MPRLCWPWSRTQFALIALMYCLRHDYLHEHNRPICVALTIPSPSQMYENQDLEDALDDDDGDGDDDDQLFSASDNDNQYNIYDASSTILSLAMESRPSRIHMASSKPKSFIQGQSTDKLVRKKRQFADDERDWAVRRPHMRNRYDISRPINARTQSSDNTSNQPQQSTTNQQHQEPAGDTDYGEDQNWLNDGIDNFYIDPETRRAANGEVTYDEGPVADQQDLDREYAPDKSNGPQSATLSNRRTTTTITEVIPLGPKVANTDNVEAGAAPNVRHWDTPYVDVAHQQPYSSSSLSYFNSLNNQPHLTTFGTIANVAPDNPINAMWQSYG